MLDCYFSKTFEPSDQLIKAYAGFFEWPSSVKEVCLLGHSFSYVDAPCFEAMLRNPSVRQADFYLPVYDPVDQLISFGVAATQIRTCNWAELCFPRPPMSTINN